MKRTQIFLSTEETAALDRLARSSGRTRSHLIREAVDRAYLSRTDAAGILEAVQRSAGVWKGRRSTGSAYVERLRSGRLARLHPRSK